jgi:hypothetical protein
MAFIKAALLLTVSIGLGVGQTAPVLPNNATSVEAKPTSIHIGAHQLGETVQEWLSIESLPSLLAMCARRIKDLSKLWNNDPIMARTEDRVAEECRKNSDELQGSHGVITVGDYGDRQYEWKFIDSKLAVVVISLPAYWPDHLSRTIEETEDLKRTTEVRSQGDYAVRQAELANRLAAIRREGSPSSPEPNATQEIKFLTEAYGTPTNTRNISFQNGYGAKWDCLEATWEMPDGSVIQAAEGIRNISYGARRGLKITFASKAALDKTKAAETNPYKH